MSRRRWGFDIDGRGGVWYYDTDFADFLTDLENMAKGISNGYPGENDGCGRRAQWEGRRMEHTRELLEQTGGAAPVAGSPAKDSGLRSVQDLESVINEGLRAALLEEIGRAHV